jgi:hypothetical protein
MSSSRGLSLRNSAARSRACTARAVDSTERFQPLRDKQAAAIEAATARYESQRGAHSG